ncbi:MAG: histone deacetylase [Desulfobacterales bacterium]|jgi:acetoin utilization deacetylase AcuC-like enzyme|nr:histone deacetylase [Desulfobacterales bacterium]
MKRTGFLYDERYLLHKTGPYHPEVPERLEAILQGVSGEGLLDQLVRITAAPAELIWVHAVHTPDYVKRFEAACRSRHPTLDSPDNQMCPETYQVALLAVGGILETVRRVMAGELDNAFCAVRPPGHHAEAGRAMGFCYFNNVAIAARYLQKQWGLHRIGIVDFDVHHGNGTQHIFEDDPEIYYYSIHQHPTFAYPGTGREFEYGRGTGYGFTKNSPVLPGVGDDDWMQLIERDLVPAFTDFKPEFILVSAGFDAHRDDDMSDIKLTTECYSWIMKRLVEMSRAHAAGRLVSVLEGGYCLKRLPELARNHLEILLNG